MASLYASCCWAAPGGVVSQESRFLKAQAETDVNSPSSSANPKTLPTSGRKFSGKYPASDSIGPTMGQAYS